MKSITSKLSLLLRFSLSDFKAKYSGSVLGIIWAVAEPLVTVLVYRFVYSVAFGQNEIDGIPYYIWLSVGIAAWFFISDGLKAVCSTFRDYSYLIRKTSFNKRLLPTVRAVSSAISHILFMTIVLSLCVICKIPIKGFGYLIATSVICFTFILLLGKLLALLCGYIKDVQNIVGVVLNISFWLTPVFWNISALPVKLIKLVELNPAALIVEGYRQSVFYGCFLSLDKLCYLFLVLTLLYIMVVIAEEKLLPDIADKL